METEVYQVNAFVSESLAGNPAGVCITPGSLTLGVMQQVAASLKLSETAFLALDSMTLRWFTPLREVALCGHGTLAMTHQLYQLGYIQNEEIVHFDTLSGRLAAEVTDGAISLFFPIPELYPNIAAKAELLVALGVPSDVVVYFARFGEKDMVVVEDEKWVLHLTPNFDQMRCMPGRGVVVTALSLTHDADFISRYFAPWVGVNEDPVTGSAHCALYAYWSRQLGKTELLGYQASEQGGLVSAERLSENIVRVSGQAKTVQHHVMDIGV